MKMVEINTKKDRVLKELEQVKLLLEGIYESLDKMESIEKEDLESFISELKDPISSIKGYTDMLLEGHFGDLNEQQKEKLSRMKTNTDLVISIVSKMLERSQGLK